MAQTGTAPTAIDRDSDSLSMVRKRLSRNGKRRCPTIDGNTMMSAPLIDLLEGQYTPVDDGIAGKWRSLGHWENRSIRSLLTETATTYPNREALVGYREGAEPIRQTYADLDMAAHHVASVLDAIGVGQGDTVVLMLPNWVEYAAFVFGINEIGAIYSGIPVAYGERQAAAVLRRSKAKVLVIPRSHRSTQHLDLSRRLRAEIPTLEHVIVLDEDDSDLEPQESLWASHDGVPTKTFPDPDPGRICYLGFTSGTTGEPKGAMHTHETLIYSLRAISRHVGATTFGQPMVQQVASPAGHHTGFAFGILMTVAESGTGVHVEKWDLVEGVEVIRKERVTCFFGAPTFVQDMMRSDLVGDPQCPLTCLVIAGSPVPRSLPAQAGQALGAYVAPAWGMTECGILSSCTPSEPAGIQLTDGSIFAGSEAKVIGDDDESLPAGERGQLLIRGPGVALGYYDRPDATKDAFLPGLWFRTGDLAVVDANSWLSLQGRSKDIIIRGGENIPVTDVESAIFDHPDVLNAAVVGIPDARLGERICAVLVLRQGTTQTVESLAEFLLSRGLSKHYLPEKVIELDALPMTPSGKIQKFKLRDLATNQ